ncbi:Roadkill [Operophtera brumata]|uniref:Roadkill n=1 Tax=Operophtera brumata TaxID=104452 RepID=A0A0L7L2A6_OPEBR|nr:Roadkill [Operophtera brumata]
MDAMEDNPNRYKIRQDKCKEEETDIYNIQWIVPIFNKLLGTKPMARGFRTPRYTVVEVPNSIFQLKMCFFGIKSEVMEIYFLTSTCVFLKSSLDVSLGDFSKNYLKDYRTVQANEWQYCAALKNIINANITVNDPGSLNLSFKFTVAQAIKAAVCNSIPLPYTQLSEDFGTLLTDDIYSDVTMKSADGVEFRAHKSVLAVRSKVLRAHFEHNTKESITNVVDTPFETEVLRDVLTFVYKDEVPRVADAPDKLLAAADYYQLERLKNLCEEALYKRLTVDNAIETLQLAELHSANTLGQSTLGFIKNRRLKLVTKTEGWANVQSVEIIKKICEFITADEIGNADILAAALNDIE